MRWIDLHHVPSPACVLKGHTPKPLHLVMFFWRAHLFLQAYLDGIAGVMLALMLPCPQPWYTSHLIIAL